MHLAASWLKTKYFEQLLLFPAKNIQMIYLKGYLFFNLILLVDIFFSYAIFSFHAVQKTVDKFGTKAKAT